MTVANTDQTPELQYLWDAFILHDDTDTPASLAPSPTKKKYTVQQRGWRAATLTDLVTVDGGLTDLDSGMTPPGVQSLWRPSSRSSSSSTSSW